MIDAKGHVLAIELRSLEMLLSKVGHEVRTASCSREALEEAAQLRPELVLLDIGLPDADGYETCRRLRAEDWGRKALLVAVTGWGQPGDKRRAREAGFDPSRATSSRATTSA